MSPKRISGPLDIYVRVSDVRGRGGDSFISPRDQEERCRALASARGYEIGRVFEELNVSGGDMNRPALNEALDRIRNGASAGIIVARMDRFARTLRGAIETLEKIEDAGGCLIECDGDWDTSTPMGRFGRDLVIRLAQLYREQIADQWQTAKRHAVNRGVHIAPNVPPGYARGTDRRLSPHRKHAKTIRDAFAMAASGASDAEIAAFLNARALPTTSVKDGERDTFWQSFRVRRLLENRVYLGEARSGGIVNASAHEPLVDPETFAIVQARYTSKRRAPSSGSSLLSGLVRCASCSFSMKSQQSRGTAPAVYRCSTTSIHGRCPAPSSISKDRFERYVVDEFVAMYDELLVAEADVDAPDVRELAAEARQAEESYRRALGNVDLRRQIGDADHDEHVAALHRAWRELQSDLEAARVPAPIADLPAGMTMRAFVDSASPAELRRVLERGIDAVFVRPAASRARNLPVGDRVKIVWRGSEDLDLPRRGERFEPRAFVW
jgi:DNA invertase Pin-like site-specific DNA recombinase